MFGAAFVNGEHCSSTPVQDDSHPVINRCCNFGIQPVGIKVDLVLLDADLLDEDDVIGTSCVQVDSVTTQQATPRWVPLAAPPRADTSMPPPAGQEAYNAGELLLLTMLIDEEEDDDAPSSRGYNVTTYSTASAEGISRARVFCPAGTALISCACSVNATGIANSECTGAEIIEGPTSGTGTRGCEATASGMTLMNDAQSGLVAAHARCIATRSTGMSAWDGQADRYDFTDDCRQDGTTCVSVSTSAVSGSQSGDATTAKCRRPSSVVSCSAYGEPSGSAKMLGVELEAVSDCVGIGCTGLIGPSLNGDGVVCTAYAGNTPLGSGVRAQAICSPTGSDALILPVHSDRTYDVNTTTVSVTCPPSFTLGGCACHSHNGHCRGAKPEANGQTCTAQLSRGTSFWTAGGRAIATCLLRTPRADLDWFRLAPSPPPAAPQGPLSPTIQAECTRLDTLRGWLGTKPWLPAAVQRSLSGRKRPVAAVAQRSPVGGQIPFFIAGFAACVALVLLAMVVRMLIARRTKRARIVQVGGASGPPLSASGITVAMNIPMLSDDQQRAIGVEPSV